MSRYIDADKLLDALYEHEFTILCPLDEVSNVIDAEPTADVEEVVRCRDCLWRDFEDARLNWMQGFYVCRQHKRSIDLDGYCSDSKRKVQE